jgi:hypothetical protein
VTAPGDSTVAAPAAWTPSTPLAQAARWSELRLDALTVGRWWALKAMAVSVAVGMFVAAPPIGGFDDPGGKLWRYVFANSGPQLFDPDVTVHDQPGNLTFRVVPRLIAAVFGFDQQWQYYLVQLAFGLLLLWAAAQVFEEVVGSRTLATLLTIATATTWAGATGWIESRALFDAIGIAFLALAMRTRRPVVAVLLALAASFSDERALIALPMVLCWHALRPAAVTSGPGSSDPADGAEPATSDPGATDVDRDAADVGGWRRFMGPLPLAIVAAVVLHVAIRTWLKHRYGLHEGQNREPEDPITQLRNYPNGLWGALEGLWLVVAAGLATLVHRGRWVVAVLALLAAVPVLLAGVSVVDISRAVAYAWPLAPLAALGLRGLPRESVRRLVWVATGACVVWPMVYAAGEQSVDWIYPAPLQLLSLLTGRA